MRVIGVGLVVAIIFLSGCSPAESTQVRTYALGEHVPVGRLVYTIFERKWVTQFGEGATARVPQHRFCVIRLSAVNSGGTDLIVPALTLQDDKGESYSELQNGDGVAQWIGVLRTVKPAEALQGNIIFDCPPQHYKLRVTDENEERAAVVDLPLSFDSEMPQLFVPTEKKK